MKHLRIAVLLGIALLIALQLTSHSQAAGVVGTGTPGSCTQAALFAAVASGPGTITFNCGAAAHTITLTSPLVIDHPNRAAAFTIDGGGRITLSGGGRSRVIDNRRNLTLRNITIADGYASGYQIGDGAGIKSDWSSNLSIFDSRFINNVSVTPPPSGNATPCWDRGGGAIHFFSGTLIIERSEFRGNVSRNGSGGAVHSLVANVQITDTLFDGNRAESCFAGAFYSDGTYEYAGTNRFVRLWRSTFTNNTAAGQGGAVVIFSNSVNEVGAQLSVDQSSFVNNSTGGNGLGGALRLGGNAMTVSNSLFSGNRASSQGGAIWLGEDTLTTLYNLTITGNRAESADGRSGFGGAIFFNSRRATTVSHVTIANNHAGFTGGGLYGAANVTLSNTIIAHNTAANGGNNWNIDQQCADTYLNGGGVIMFPLNRADSPGDNTCAPGNTGVDPRLAPLAANGGLTQTRALLAGSPAIDAGGSACTNPPVGGRDQRGLPRPVDGNGDGSAACDLGAFEVQAGAAAPTATPRPAATATPTTGAIPAGASVVSLSLINTQTQAVLVENFTGGTVNLSQLGASQISIRANTNPATVGSVRFVMNGSVQATENVAPYALAGDNNGRLHPWNYTLNVPYTLIATPYTSSHAGGSAGTPRSITFTLTNATPTLPPPTATPQTSGLGVTSLTLINAANEQPIAGYDPIPNNAVIDLGLLGVTQVNIRANTNPATVGSVRFIVNGVNFATENVAPYALAGDSSGNYNAWTFGLNTPYTISATAYTASQAGGTAGASATVSFTLVNSAANPNVMPQTMAEGGITAPITDIVPTPETIVPTLEPPVEEVKP